MKKLSDEQINELLNSAVSATEENTGLTAVFSRFAEKYGRAKGGVRNLYYSLVKQAASDAALREKFPSLKRLKANRGKAFTKSEQEELFEKIRNGVKKGKSARMTIKELSGGDEKTALRFQNKYRNMLKERGLTRTRVYFEDSEYRAIKKAIDDLFERILHSEGDRVRRLQDENKVLKERLDALMPSEKTRNARNYFVGSKEDIFGSENK